MEKPKTQTVYLPKINGNTCGLCHRHDYTKKEAFVFTPEQLNEYTANIIKQALENAAEKAKIKREETYEIVFKGFSGGTPSYGNKEIINCDKQSITNTFEETYRLFSVD